MTGTGWAVASGHFHVPHWYKMAESAKKRIILQFLNQSVMRAKATIESDESNNMK
jgi:hypothetical protein